MVLIPGPLLFSGDSVLVQLGELDQVQVRIAQINRTNSACRTGTQHRPFNDRPGLCLQVAMTLSRLMFVIKQRSSAPETGK